MSHQCGTVCRDGPVIDVIANFAGVIRGGPLVELDSSELETVMNVNVGGTHTVTRAFFPLLRRAGEAASPVIIIVCSEISLSRLSAAFNAPYSMSKFALEGYATALRQELSLLADPVAVTVLNPGAMRTPMLWD